MDKRDTKGNGAFIFGLILGAIGGALAALLLTPKKGDDLRKDIESKVAESAGPMRQRAEPLVTQGKERASELVDKAAERAQEVSGKIAAMDVPSVGSDSDQEPSSTSPTAATSDEHERTTGTSS